MSSKDRCPSCGKLNQAGHNFCTACGSALIQPSTKIHEKLIKDIIESSKKETRKRIFPLVNVGASIVRASYTCFKSLEPFICGQDDAEKQQNEVLVFWEFLFFFMHMTLRAASSRLTRAKIKKLQDYLWPMIVGTAVDSFFLDWPIDMKQELTTDFYAKLKESELDYSLSKELLSKEDLFTGGSLQAKLARKIAEASGSPLNPVTIALVVEVSTNALIEFNFVQLVGEAGKVLSAYEAVPEEICCPKCGNPNGSTNNFCVHCGSPLDYKVSANNRREEPQEVAEKAPMNLKIPLLPCKNPGCRNYPARLPANGALAMLEYQLRDDPAARITLPCEVCGTTSSYSYSEVYEMLPPTSRPTSLPENQKMVLLLMKVGNRMDNDAVPFFGELLKSRVILRPDKQTTLCELLQRSQFSPRLILGEQLLCMQISDYLVVTSRYVNGNWEEIPFEVPKPSSVDDFGSFFSFYKADGSEFLRPANLRCSNPSCNYFFSQRSSQLFSMLEDTKHQMVLHGAAEAHVTLICPKCGVCRLVNKQVIDALYPM